MMISATVSNVLPLISRRRFTLFSTLTTWAARSSRRGEGEETVTITTATTRSDGRRGVLATPQHLEASRRLELHQDLVVAALENRNVIESLPAPPGVPIHEHDRLDRAKRLQDGSAEVEACWRRIPGDGRQDDSHGLQRVLGRQLVQVGVVEDVQE
eukprot:2122093-Pyramimonas_sp.AAC.1